MPSKPSSESSAFTLDNLRALSQSTPLATTTSKSLIPVTSEPGSIKNEIVREAESLPIGRGEGSLERIERSLGGREAVIDRLALTSLDKKQEHFLRLLADPKRAKDKLTQIARDAGLRPIQVLELIKTATGAASMALALGKLSEALPAVVDDLTAKAVDARIECPDCLGQKKINDQFCLRCGGLGEIMRQSDLDRQKIVLESTGVIKKGGSGLNVNVNQQVGIVSPGNFFSRYVKSSDADAYDVTVEAEDAETS